MAGSPDYSTRSAQGWSRRPGVTPANVMIDADGRVTAVLDFSVHARAVDLILDQVGAVVNPYPGNGADAACLQHKMIGRLDVDGWLVDAYRRFGAVCYAIDHGLIPWCAEQRLNPVSGR
ncbi:hypothetical protein [Micropruina sp.]|uniref:hypothetical protein n=1 Tax=Micropruina sp. TaxID=2737536 RepID=UPI0039E29E09